ncbi:hypothetical protein [Eubacterium limosum]|uniref:DUF3168 domain-containing protein n=1 Tax=Eubacterium limosum TaxID=1736 RepID=A0ABT5UV44_EUBLI|nr:hypothetical protein [Eubacterium limosum]MDE1472830.1 hypothetical protein [Eubacterium limosum]
MENDVIAYIGEQIPDLKQSIYPVYSTNVEKPSLVYGSTPISYGAVNQTQLSLRVLAQDFDVCKHLCTVLCETLDMSQDTVYRLYKSIRFRADLSGGSEPTAFDASGTEMFEAALYFIINWRKRNVTG